MFICIGNRTGPRAIRIDFTRIFNVFTKLELESDKGNLENFKKNKIVKLILNCMRAHCDYLLIT